MPYSKFKLEEVIEKFNLKLKREVLFKKKKVKISNWLKESLAFSKKLSIRTEKARSELIVTPIYVVMN